MTLSTTPLSPDPKAAVHFSDVGGAGGAPVWFGAIFAAAGFIFACIGWVLCITQQYRLTIYQPAPARIISSRVQSHTDHDGTTYEPMIIYSYTVDGRQYESDHTTPLSIYASWDWATKIVSEFPPHSAATAWYDPNHPSSAMLIHEASPLAYVFCLFPAPFIAIGIYVIAAGLHAGRPPAAPVSDGHGWYRVAEEGTIRHRFRTAAIATAAWYFYGAITVGDYFVVRELRPDAFFFIATAIVLAAGLGGVYVMRRYWRLDHEFLDADISISQQQARAGDTIQLRMQQELLLPLEIDVVALGLVCICDEKIRNGNKTSYSSSVAWSHWNSVKIDRLVNAGHPLHGEIKVAIPPDADASTERGDDYPHYRWRITLGILVKGQPKLMVHFPLEVADKQA